MDLKDWLLKKQFILVEKIGSGTFGVVYKIEGPEQQVYALKKIKFDKNHFGIPPVALREISILKKMSKCKQIIKLIEVVQFRESNSFNKSRKSTF